MFTEILSPEWRQCRYIIPFGKETHISILENKTIYATPMPWTGVNAVCFTECLWMSIVGHARRYSPYGIAFKKPFIFSRDGGPAFYI